MTERRVFLRRAILIVSLALAVRVQADDVPVVRSFSAAPGQVELVLSAPTGFQLAFLSGSPGRGQADRCYVDVSPASINRQIRPVLDVQEGPLRRVRVSQFNAGTVRVVLDLRSVQRCQVSTLTEPDRILITAGRTQSVSERNAAANWRGLAVPWVQAVPLPEVTQAAVSSGLALPQAEPTPDVLPQTEHAQDFGAEPLLQTWRHLSLGLRPFSPLPFLPENLRHAPSPIKRTLAEILTGGVIMHDLWTLAIVIGLLFAFLGGGVFVRLFSGKGRKEKKDDGWEQRMAHLEEAVNRAGVINNSFFHGLEISQKRLGSLLTQADWAEQNLRRLLAQTTSAGGEKIGAREEHYATATLLLAEGDSAQQVARVLKLPLARVRLLQELQQEIKEEKDADPQEKGASKNDGSEEAVVMNGLATRRNGSFHNGIHLAAQG